jgi:hypothetical protein
MKWLILAIQGRFDPLDGLLKLTLGFAERRLEQFEVRERLEQRRGRSFEYFFAFGCYMTIQPVRPDLLIELHRAL